MSAAHSPGPWHYRAMLTASENHTGFRIYDSRGNWALAEVQPGDQDGIEGEANARLIATAPKLLHLASRWAALDGGAWHVERHAREKAELLAETEAAVREATA